MKLYKLILIFVGFSLNLNAQDSIMIKKNNYKWNLSFSVENNYNFRYVRKPNFLELGYPVNYDYTQADLDYLDTNNIACTMNSFSVKMERKIWKFISLQTGFTFGRKGFMGCKDLGSGTFGKPFVYYTYIPQKIVSVPFILTFTKQIIKKRFFISFDSGVELNLLYTKQYDYAGGSTPYDYVLSGQKVGFFGFKTTKNINEEVLYVPKQDGSLMSGTQYNIGMQFKLFIFELFFINLGYNYISDFKFYEVSDNLYLGGTVYERKSYIHRYGGGIGFMF
jgi:hypothetical protein